MSIWAIADIHSSAPHPQTGQPLKPMDRFGEVWEDHMTHLEVAWEEAVQTADTVVIAGDIDWSLHLEDAMHTLERLASWNGQKVLVRGNHDYWWSSKATNKVRRRLPPTISLIHNNAAQAEGFNICGAKGSPVPGGIEWTEENAKLLQREVNRLSLSLAARDPELPTIVALHYPPFYRGQDDSPYRELIEESGTRACVYGHLHAEAAAAGPRGCYDRVEYRLVAGDYVGFRPVLIAREGRVASDEDGAGAKRKGSSATG